MPVDCLNCDGHCCHVGKLFLLPEEIAFFEERHPGIKILKISSVGFYDLSEGCVFQKGHLCGIYKNRPLNCRVFPFNIIAGTDGKTFGFDFGWCERCDPGDRSKLVTTEDWFKAYGITIPQHLGYACLWVLKELRSRHVLGGLSKEEIEEFTRVQTELLIAAGHHEATLPVFDPKYLSALFYFGQMVYQAYTLTHNKYMLIPNRKHITTRSFVAETMKNMKDLLLHNKNQPIEY